MGRALWVSVQVTTPAVILSLLLASMAAYALSRYAIPFRRTILLTMLAGNLLPPQILLIPVAKITESLGVYDSVRGLIAIHIGFGMGFYTFVLHGFMRSVPAEITDAARMEQVRLAARRVHVDDAVYEYVLRVARATREHSALSVGLSTRATVAMAHTARTLALLSGRPYATPEDVKTLAQPVWAHRLVLSPEASVGGRTGTDVLTEILQATPAPQPGHPGAAAR